MEEICDRCVEKWGVNHNLNQATEELAELIVAINKYRRYGVKALDNLAEEIGDVEIVLGCLKSVFKYTKMETSDTYFSSKITHIKTKKLRTLIERLGNGDNL